MLSIFKNIFGSRFASENEALKDQKAIAVNGNIEERLALAEDPDTHREILYYLAEHDDSTGVRRAVLNNPSMPAQTMEILAKDEDDEIRGELTDKLTRKINDIIEETNPKLRDSHLKTLEILVHDKVQSIRLALASTLKEHSNAPPRIVGELARDLEQKVAEPVLRFCKALTDDVMIDILRNTPQSWQTQAIAQRETVSSEVSEAVIDTEDVLAGQMLMKNAGAEFTDALKDKIIDKSRHIHEWQASIVDNLSITSSMAKTFVEFADEAVKSALLARDDIHVNDLDDIVKVFHRRMEFSEKEKDVEDPKARVTNAADNGKISEEMMSDAVSMKDFQFVYEGLAMHLMSDSTKIEKVFATKLAKPIVSLVWKAGFSMKLAVKMQKEIAHIQASHIIHPNMNKKFPLTPSEMDKQLKLLNLWK